MTEPGEPEEIQPAPVEPEIPEAPVELPPAEPAPEPEPQPEPAPEPAPEPEPEPKGRRRRKFALFDRFRKKQPKAGAAEPEIRPVPMPLAAGLLSVPIILALLLGAAGAAESGFFRKFGRIFSSGTLGIMAFLSGEGSEEPVEEPVPDLPVPVPVIRDQPKGETPKPSRPVAPAPDASGVTVNDTGAFWFICKGSHDEWEAIISDCPSCGKSNRLYQDPSGQGIFCFACRAKLPTSAIICDKCGKPPAPGSRLKLKHR